MPMRIVALRENLCIKEAADYLGVSYWWMRRRIADPDGPPSFRNGKLIRIPRDEFVDWANQTGFRIQTINNEDAKCST